MRKQVRMRMALRSHRFVLFRLPLNRGNHTLSGALLGLVLRYCCWGPGPYGKWFYPLPSMRLFPPLQEFAEFAFGIILITHDLVNTSAYILNLRQSLYTAGNESFPPLAGIPARMAEKGLSGRRTVLARGRRILFFFFHPQLPDADIYQQQSK